MKWGCPCYTLDGKNVVMLTALRDRCGLSFFEGALLTDAHGLLERPGPNTRAARELPITSLDQVHAHREAIRAFLAQAIALEKQGAKVAVDAEPEPIPEELEARLAADAALRAAFDALTPGRQRSHILYVGGAKKPQTRVARAERCAAKILEGKGFNER